MSPETVVLIRQSWSQVMPRRKQVCGDFYRRLFATYPELRPLFQDDLARQTDLFVTMVNTVVSALDNPGPVLPLLETLGARHAAYGVSDDDYDKFEAVLLDTLAASLGETFTPTVRAAWSEVYGRLADRMRRGAANRCVHRR